MSYLKLQTLLAALAVLPLMCLPFGCSGSQVGPSPSAPGGSRFNAPATINLNTFNDPWPMAQQRFMDIDDARLTAFGNRFTYGTGQVTLTYDQAPTNAYFTAHIEARRLKPNFAYQLKLAGKPRLGSRGWGSYGDDVANERIGFAGRWWCDSEQMNVNDDHYLTYYKSLHQHTVYGYLFMGDFVTDQFGNASLDVNGSHSYHITWQDKQTYGIREVVAGVFSVRSDTSPYYGYGRPIAPKTIKLWYEKQSGRAFNVRLPNGTYNCRLLITEETFHNFLGGTNDPAGGFWPTVLASEDLDINGQPDTSTGNDIMFRVGG